MYNIVNNFLYKNEFIYKYQFGFRKIHSTQHAINTLVDRITSSLDSGDLVIGVFLDLKRAFDTVDHHILIKKLFSYGIRGNTLKWFQSFLTDRSQFVTYDGIESKVLPFKYGVPQGSILEPLLFIIYMNDLFNVSNFLFTILYADDRWEISGKPNYVNESRITLALYMVTIQKVNIKFSENLLYDFP